MQKQEKNNLKREFMGILYSIGLKYIISQKDMLRIENFVMNIINQL